MICPRCENTVLTEREREGLLVDACPNCRGIWLDRGELEKLIARATREYDEDPPMRVHEAAPFRRDHTPPRGVRYPSDSDRHPSDPKKRQRHWLDALGDIFD